MSRHQFELATEGHDAELRKILAATPMPGTISVTFRREPSYFDAAVVDGTFRQTIACRELDMNRVVGFGSRSVREMYVNGQPTPIGYLSMLRTLPEYRNKGLVARGYKYLRELHDDGRVELYLTTIAEGNERAMSVLTSGRAGLPRYHEAGRYLTVAIPISRRPKEQYPNGHLCIRPATLGDLKMMLEFLDRQGPERQFFPCYRAGDFFNSKGTFRDMSPSDLLLAFDKERLVGMLGGWDQHRFRQTVVDTYTSPLLWIRPLYNCWSAICGRPQLPRPGEPFRYLTAALPVVENHDPHVFSALLEHLLVHASTRGCDYLLLGLHETDPLSPLVAVRGTATYMTRLYHACWADGEALRSGLDGRPPYLELGCL